MNEHVENWGQWDNSIIDEQMRNFTLNQSIDVSQINPLFPPRSRMHHLNTKLQEHPYN